MQPSDVVCVLRRIPSAKKLAVNGVWTGEYSAGRLDRKSIIPEVDLASSSCTQTPWAQRNHGVGICICGGSVASRSVARFHTNVTCHIMRLSHIIRPPRLSLKQQRPRLPLSCRRVCTRELLARVYQWRPSAKVYAQLGQQAARRYADRVAKHQSWIDLPMDREAIVYTTRVFSWLCEPGRLHCMSNCSRDSVDAIARSNRRKRALVVLAEHGCEPTFLASLEHPPICILTSSLPNISVGAWALFNGKSGGSKGGFVRWLASSTTFDRAWLVEDDVHLDGRNWSRIFNAHASTPAELITLSPTGQLLHGNVSRGVKKAWDCTVDDTPCLAAGQTTLLKSYLQVARLSRSLAVELAQGLDAGTTRGHHEFVVAARCERSDSWCAPTCPQVLGQTCPCRSLSPSERLLALSRPLSPSVSLPLSLSMLAAHIRCSTSRGSVTFRAAQIASGERRGCVPACSVTPNGAAHGRSVSRAGCSTRSSAICRFVGCCTKT